MKKQYVNRIITTLAALALSFGVITALGAGEAKASDLNGYGDNNYGNNPGYDDNSDYGNGDYDNEYQYDDTDNYGNSIENKTQDMDSGAPVIKLKGSGTSEDPYLISSVEDIMTMRFDENLRINYGPDKPKYFELTSDLIFNDDYKNYKNWGKKAPNNKIVTKSTSYSGEKMGENYIRFDGKGHTLYGLYLVDDSLFYYLYDSTLKNTNISHFYAKNTPVIASSVSCDPNIERKSLIENVKISNGIVVFDAKTVSKELLNATGVGAIFNQAYDAIIKNVSVNINFTTDLYKNSGMLVGYCDGMIENCTTKGKFTVKPDKKDQIPYSIGGIAGESLKSIKNCKNEAAITVTTPPKGNVHTVIGGIAGQDGEHFVNSKEIKVDVTDCTNSGKITVKTKYNVDIAKKNKTLRQYVIVGGLIGNSYNATIKNCKNTADISCQYSTYIGGISGYGEGKCSLNNCLNTGNIKTLACGYIGGIVGRHYGDILYCENRGEIINTETLVNKQDFFIDCSLAGIAAKAFVYKNDVKISNCKNTGHINAIDTSLWTHSSGIAGTLEPDSYYGSNKKAILTDCVNTGLIEGGLLAGIVGSSGSTNSKVRYTIKNCINAGTLRHNYEDDRIGGIVAFTANDKANNDIINCYNTGVFEKTVKNRYGDKRESQIIIMGDASNVVSDCYILAESENKWPAVSQNGVRVNKVTRLPRATIVKMASYKKILKNAGLKKS